MSQHLRNLQARLAHALHEDALSQIMWVDTQDLKAVLEELQQLDVSRFKAEVLDKYADRLMTDNRWQQRAEVAERALVGVKYRVDLAAEMHRALDDWYLQLQAMLAQPQNPEAPAATLREPQDGGKL